MKHSYIGRLLLALVLLSAVFHPALLYAEQSVQFHMDTVPDGDRLQVKISASHAVDVYAYELRLTFDSARWRLQQSASGLQGFSVDPRIQDNKLRIAHTMIGSVPGQSGELVLATLTFERVGTGIGSIRLEEAKLVSSKLASATYTPGLQAAISGAGFTDIAGHWAERTILQAEKLGIVNGFEDGSFRPDELVNRAEYATMLIRALKTPSAPEISAADAGTDASATTAFTDRDLFPAWAVPYIDQAASTRLVTGYDDGTFRPDRPLTRMEMTAMTVRSLGPVANMSTVSEALFADDHELPAWGRPYAARALAQGLIQGRINNRFAPQDTATRAEAITIILNLLRENPL